MEAADELEVAKCEYEPIKSSVQDNKLRGNGVEQELADVLREAGRDVTQQVVKKTPFGPRVIDIEVSMNGRVLGGIEVKSGDSVYKASQRAKDMWLFLFEGYRVDVVRF